MQKRPPSDAGTSGKQRSLIRALDYQRGLLAEAQTKGNRDEAERVDRRMQHVRHLLADLDQRGER